MALRDTPNGYNPYSVASAMQKCIRRGVEYDAYWWAHELAINQQVTWVWNRLTVIACEDVGMGDPQALLIVQACRQAWEQINGNKDAADWEWNILAHAVIYLCRARKSRSADDLSHLVWLKKSARDPKNRQPTGGTPERLQIPLIALDMHTRDGKTRIANIARRTGEDEDSLSTRLFREEGARLNKPARDLSNEGANWTEEVCKLQGADVGVAMTPASDLRPTIDLTIPPAEPSK
jgi:hypothetical protein